jgi:hypothetical protein
MPATFALDRYCAEHDLTGYSSEHELPFLPHRVTVRTQLGTQLAEAAGWTPELAATAMLRRLHAA